MAIAAVGQICSSRSMSHNLEQCVQLVAKAAAAGAKVLFLPEASDYIAISPEESRTLAKPESASPFVTGLQSAAAQHSLAVHVGIHAPAPSTNKLYNRTIWINPDGSLNDAARYDKLHLFDYAKLRESASTQAGPSLTAPFASPIGRIGSLICFDLRFPEPALHLAQPPASSSSTPPAQVLLYPSAFTVPTGRAAHWDVLLRARAIETQSYVIAAAQVGRHNPGSSPRVSYGRSMVVDPWGRVLVELGGVAGEAAEDWEAEEGAVGQLGLVDIDLGEWERVREGMPLKRRTDVYPQV